MLVMRGKAFHSRLGVLVVLGAIALVSSTGREAAPVTTASPAPISDRTAAGRETASFPRTNTTAGTKYAVQHDNWAVMPTGGNKYGGVLPRNMGDFQIRGPGGATLRHPRPLIRYPHGSGTILVEDDIDAGPDFDPPPARPKWRERAPQGTTPPSP